VVSGWLFRSFFNRLSARLEIELTEPPERIAPNLANERASASARIHSLRLRARVFEAKELRPLTAEELARVALDAPVIRLRGDSGDPVEHAAPNGAFFTVSDLLQAVEETERQTRSASEWFGGIDVHHVFFEGLMPEKDGSWSIAWGS
jgi:hypothetical protein